MSHILAVRRATSLFYLPYRILTILFARPWCQVVPTPYELWPEKYRRAVFPLNLLFSFAWSLEMWVENLWQTYLPSITQVRYVGGSVDAIYHKASSFVQSTLTMNCFSGSLISKVWFDHTASTRKIRESTKINASHRTMLLAIPCHRRPIPNLLVQKRLFSHMGSRLNCRACIYARGDNYESSESPASMSVQSSDLIIFVWLLW